MLIPTLRVYMSLLPCFFVPGEHKRAHRHTYIHHEKCLFFLSEKRKWARQKRNVVAYELLVGSYPNGKETEGSEKKEVRPMKLLFAAKKGGESKVG